MNPSDDDPQGPADLERIWQHRKATEDADLEAYLTREERLEAMCTWGLGILAILGIWKALELLGAVLFWLLTP